MPYFYEKPFSFKPLKKPIHIHIKSFKPAFETGPGLSGALGAIGTFLVTVSNPHNSPAVHTARVSGINHIISKQGVIDGWVASITMALDNGRSPIVGVLVKLHESGDVAGFVEGPNGGIQKTELEEVWFSYGDTVLLDGRGEPFGEMDQPGATQPQKIFLEEQRLLEPGKPGRLF